MDERVRDAIGWYGKVKVVLTVDPPSHPGMALMMRTSRYVEEMGPRWGQLLGKIAQALTDGFNLQWVKVEPAYWCIPRTELQTLGIDAPNFDALPAVVSSAYAEVNVLAHVKIVRV